MVECRRLRVEDAGQDEDRVDQRGLAAKPGGKQVRRKVAQQARPELRPVQRRRRVGPRLEPAQQIEQGGGRLEQVEQRTWILVAGRPRVERALERAHRLREGLEAGGARGVAFRHAPAEGLHDFPERGLAGDRRGDGLKGVEDDRDDAFGQMVDAHAASLSRDTQPAEGVCPKSSTLQLA